ncbi:hypothetical protein AAE250_22290 [Bacteroides sp. GD17]|jgi:hypothetical protein|uniref:hypothetical protein n=1 Tax=Bacteroides sp. GD17 TaxID=3139826 RepID=UPI0025F1CCB1|nr:hypothetical protein [uncultured Bacteroides sp.]
MKGKDMGNYIILTALITTILALMALIILFLHCRKTKREYERNIMKRIHEQDCIARELEIIRIEKETLEKILQTKL